MPEGFALANQRVEKQKMSLLAAAAKLGIAVVGSATLYQGHLTQGVPEFVAADSGIAYGRGECDSVLAVGSRVDHGSGGDVAA